MIRSLGAILLLAFATTPFRAQTELPSIRNFLRVDPNFCTGGQPRLEHFDQLKAEGVRAIVNLRQPSEHRAGEEEAVVFGDPKDEQVTELRDGWTIERAEEEAVKVGLRDSPHLTEFARGYVARHRTPTIK